MLATVFSATVAFGALSGIGLGLADFPPDSGWDSVQAIAPPPDSGWDSVGAGVAA
ncbi:hypothetical protein [Streptomyces sp. NPDC002889]|uniref:hypothetical protein n=1 Tax=Streptomyces sp. NPDC002889 TaxID=3364669 RepID=UPI00367A89C3